MRLGTVRTIYRKEILDTLRDRRTLIFMLAIPMVAVPALIMAMSKMVLESVTKETERTSVVVVEGWDFLPSELQADFESASNMDVKSAEEFSAGDSTGVSGAREALSAGSIEAVVIVPQTFSDDLDDESQTKIEVLFDQAELKSEFAVTRIKDVLNPYRDNIVISRLSDRGVPASVIEPFEITTQNVAPMRKLAGEKLGGMLPYLIILMCFIGAIYPAIDLAAGEKERGTLETLLVSPASRGEFVMGKYLVILTTSLVAALLSMVSMTLSINYMLEGLASELGKMLFLEIDLSTAVLIAIVILPLAGMFAAVLLSVSVFARSFKEAQNYSSALTMLVLLPAVASIIPGTEMNIKLALIPVLSASLIIKDAVAGTVDWKITLVSFVSTLTYASLLLYFAKKWFERESVLFRM